MMTTNKEPTEVITLESLRNIKADKTDFGSPIYFMTEQQFNYCMWHLEDYNKTQERLEAAEKEIKDHAKWAERLFKDPTSEPYRDLIAKLEAAEAEISVSHVQIKLLQEYKLKAEQTIKAAKELIALYFEGCSSDEFDDRIRELQALLDKANP